MSQHERGFSLVELLVVVAIVGMFSLFAVPAFREYTEARKIRATSRQFHSDLRAARQLAVTQRALAKITFDTTAPANASYEIATAPLPGPAEDFGDVTWTTQRARELERGVTFYASAADPTFADQDGDGAPDIIFRPDGTLPASGTARFRTDANIPDNQHAITVNLTGQIQTEKSKWNTTP